MRIGKELISGDTVSESGVVRAAGAGPLFAAPAPPWLATASRAAPTAEDTPFDAAAGGGAGEGGAGATAGGSPPPAGASLHADGGLGDRLRDAGLRDRGRCASRSRSLRSLSGIGGSGRPRWWAPRLKW